MVYWGGGTVLSQTRLRFDQPDRVIDVKSHWCQPCEHIGVGVLAGSKDFSLLLGRREKQMCLAFMNSCACLGDCCRICKPFGPRQQKISFIIDLITEFDI